MVRYISEKRLTIEEPKRSGARRSQFKTPFQQQLSADNRWVKLSQVVPWDEFASAYMPMMDSRQGPCCSRILIHKTSTISYFFSVVSDKLYFRTFIHVVEFLAKQIYNMKGNPRGSTLLFIFLVGHY